MILLCSLLLSMCPCACAEEPDISAKSCILIHSGAGEVLYEKNADEPMLIASLTKIMTAIVVIENCYLDEPLDIPESAVYVEGSSMYLDAKKQYTMRQLLTGLMLASGNDAALALAELCAGDVDSFVAMMNEKASQLGLINTHFENPHGLDGNEHRSTARDLALLMDYCMGNATFASIIYQSAAEVNGVSYVNHNKLLKSLYGCIGGKTGYTMAAGRCLVSCCEREGLRLICVTLSDPNDWDEHILLYERAFSEYSYIDAATDLRCSVPIISGDKESAELVPHERFCVLMKDGWEISVSPEVPMFEFAPVYAGDPAGHALVYVNGELKGEIPLYYERDVQWTLDSR